MPSQCNSGHCRWCGANHMHAVRRTDKNQHRLEEADDKFKEISNAYEVLSDQHEREW